MSERKPTGAARKVLVGKEERQFLGIRLPKLRLTSLGTSTISLPSPPRMLFLMLTYVVLFWLISGGIYALVRNPIAMGATGPANARRPLYFYPSLNEAFLIEGFIAAIMIFVGGFGGILLYQSSLNAMNKSYAIKLMLVGLILSMVSFLVLQYIVNIKLGIID
ncbi:MAG: hypothetical protein ACFFCS_07810 [Candidatus Hodarchaeota archaeon]